MKRLPALVFLLLAPSGAAFGQDIWPPPLPKFELTRPELRPSRGVTLDPQVLEPGLSILIKNDVNGLGAQAVLVSRWSRGRKGLRLLSRSGVWSLSDSAGISAPLSPELAAALSRMNQYFGLTGPTLARPISHAELQAAFLTPESVAAVQKIFDRAMDERVSVGEKIFLPELGGEATLDATLHFHFNDDPLRPALREMIARRDDPTALARLFEEQPEIMAKVDAQGILKHHLAVRARWDREDKIPPERRDAMLRTVVDDAAEMAAGFYSSDFGNQLRTMIGDEWSGRYAGPWHCHPPDAGPDGWLGDAPPSEADYEAAAKKGQEIVIAFLPDGFDVYDLSGVGSQAPFQRAQPFSYRSADWRAHFQDLFNLFVTAAKRP